MKTLLVGLLLLAACGGKDIAGPPADEPVVLPFPQFKNDGILRFTLSQNCPAMTVKLGVDIFFYGPVAFEPGQSQDYQQAAGVYVTSGASYPTATRTFPTESITVAAGKRGVRVLTC